jgi:hypothetical protein
MACPGNERTIKYHPKKFVGYYERIPLFKAPPVKKECGMNDDVEIDFTCHVSIELCHLLEAYLNENDLVDQHYVDQRGVRHVQVLFWTYKNFHISFTWISESGDYSFDVCYAGPLGDLVTEGMLDFYSYIKLDSEHVNACNLDIELPGLHALVLSMSVNQNVPDNALDNITEEM